MKKIRLLNKIAKIGTDEFDKNEFLVEDDVENPDARCYGCKRAYRLYQIWQYNEFGKLSRCHTSADRASKTLRSSLERSEYDISYNLCRIEPRN